MVAVAMVAIGTLISATWITAANSWMHTPAGFSIDANGVFVPKIGGRSSSPFVPLQDDPYVMAAFLTTAFAVGAVGAWHLLKDRTTVRRG